MASKQQLSRGQNIKNKVKKGKLSALDGLITDLYERVQKPLEFPEASNMDLLDDIRIINRILTQIQKHERPLSNSFSLPQGRKGRTDSLKQWVEESKLKLEGVNLKETTSLGTEVVGERAFKEGELLLSIPQELLMTTFSALQSLEVGILAIKDKWFREIPSLILATFLLFEKHRPADSPSKWKSYIESLPGQHALQVNGGEHDSCLIPLAFGMETIEALEGTTALIEYHKILRSVAKQYCHVRTVLRQLSKLSPSIEQATGWFTYSEFRWAATMVMSRQFTVPVQVENGETVPALALVPLVDSFRKEEGPVSWEFSFEEGAFQVRANREFQENETLSVSFGMRPSTVLFLHGGFLPEKNSLDRIRVVVDLSPSDPLFSKKIGLLRWLEIAPTAQLDLFSDGSPSLELARWLHVATIEDESTVTAEVRVAIASRARETAQSLHAQSAEEGGAEGEEKRRQYAELVDALAKNVALAEPAEEEASRKDPAVSEDSVVGVGLGAKEAQILLTLLEERLSKLTRGGVSCASGGNGSGPRGELALALRLKEKELMTVQRAIERCKKVLS